MTKLVRFPCKSNPRIRLACFPYAGGGASLFREWAETLEHVEVCAVQLPGRENQLSATPLTSLLSAVETAAPLIERDDGLPFALYGHSLGAFLAFELARWLQKHNRQRPTHLLVSGQRAPHLPDPRSPLYELADDVFLQAVNARYGGIPVEILLHPECRQIALKLLRADLTMHDTYGFVEAPPLDCPITAFGGDQDDVRQDELQEWRVHTAASFSCRLFCGDHFFINSQRQAVLDLIRVQLMNSRLQAQAS